MSSENKWRIRVEYDKERKYPIIEVKPWGIHVILPPDYGEDVVELLLERHRHWITRRNLELKEALERACTIRLVERDDDGFRELVRRLVDEATTDILGLNPCRIVIRRMKTRWASCSSKGTLTINYFAKYLPETLLSYIIYHEVCHVIEPRHNKRFWECVKKRYPEYENLERELLAYEIRLGLHEIDSMRPASEQ